MELGRPLYNVTLISVSYEIVRARMESDSDDIFKTLDLISLFSSNQSINGSSEVEMGENNNMVSKETNKKRKTSSCKSNRMPKKERRKEIVFSKTIEMSTALNDRIAELGGFDIQIVIQKKLQDTDMNKNHGRLSIPFKKLMNDFTTEGEKKLLSQQKKKDLKNKNGMKVLIIDPLLRNRFIGLKLWKIGSHDVYCLVTQWNSLVQQNLLEAGDYIQLWSFRSNNHVFIANRQNQIVTSNLCFALVKLNISEGIFKFI